MLSLFFLCFVFLPSVLPVLLHSLWCVVLPARRVLGVLVHYGGVARLAICGIVVIPVLASPSSSSCVIVLLAGGCLCRRGLNGCRACRANIAGRVCLACIGRLVFLASLVLRCHIGPLVVIACVFVFAFKVSQCYSRCSHSCGGRVLGMLCLLMLVFLVVLFVCRAVLVVLALLFVGLCAPALLAMFFLLFLFLRLVGVSCSWCVLVSLLLLRLLASIVFHGYSCPACSPPVCCYSCCSCCA